jgi:hypothetical protein
VGINVGEEGAGHRVNELNGVAGIDWRNRGGAPARDAHDGECEQRTD